MKSLTFNILKIRDLLFVILIVFCIQFTEIKLDVIKFSELVLLLLTPFIYIKKTNKWSIYLLFFFTYWILITILLNPFRKFYPLENVSVLKNPYIISIGRFLELIACVNLFTITFNYFKKLDNKSFLKAIYYIYQFCLWLTIFNFLVYLLFFFKIINSTSLLYMDHGPRLRGWFVEGGPYGLMLSFVFILSFFLKQKKLILSRLFLVFIIFFIARSKAGVLLIITWYSIIYYKIAYKKIKDLSIVILITGGFLASFALIKLGDTYISSIKNVRIEMKERPRDVNLVMGRIAGLFIFPKMVVDNPIFGNGLGNYPILRNNPEYLDFIPKSPKGKTDAHGFGGLIQILVDGGLILLILFFLIIYDIYKFTRNKNKAYLKFLYIFLFFFVFGIQIYFLYPWIFLGITTAKTYAKKRHT